MTSRTRRIVPGLAAGGLVADGCGGAATSSGGGSATASRRIGGATVYFGAPA